MEKRNFVSTRKYTEIFRKLYTEFVWTYMIGTDTKFRLRGGDKNTYRKFVVNKKKRCFDDMTSLYHSPPPSSVSASVFNCIEI